MLLQNNKSYLPSREPGLDSLPPDLITLSGRISIDSDRNVSRSTLESLKETERELVPNDYLYLLSDHSADDVVKNVFLSKNQLGLAHIAGIIMDNLNQSMANLIAIYAANRNIPFVLAAIYIYDLKNTIGLLYYKRTETEYIKTAWRPPKLRKSPPINVEKMISIGQPSNSNVDDGYILKTFQICGGNKVETAKRLGISVPTLLLRLHALETLYYDGAIDSGFIYGFSGKMKTGDKASALPPSSKMSVPPVAKRVLELRKKEPPFIPMIEDYEDEIYSKGNDPP